MNLPAGSAGDIVAYADYARNFSTNNLTIAANGSEKIGGVAQDAELSTDGQAATFVYVDSTKGWINVQIQLVKTTETGVTSLYRQQQVDVLQHPVIDKIHTFYRSRNFYCF